MASNVVDSFRKLRPTITLFCLLKDLVRLELCCFLQTFNVIIIIMILIIFIHKIASFISILYISLLSGLWFVIILGGLKNNHQQQHAQKTSIC